MKERAAGIQLEIQFHYFEALAQAVEQVALVPLSGEGLAQRVFAFKDGWRPAKPTPSQMRCEDSMPRGQPHVERPRMLSRVARPGEQARSFGPGKAERKSQGIPLQP